VVGHVRHVVRHACAREFDCKSQLLGVGIYYGLQLCNFYIIFRLLKDIDTKSKLYFDKL